ncbi:MAG: hypothetical protein J1F24_07500 [Oscillospiraceae bacterium]|nr:hypothetical protein [Oscillospiraceae bacterium]
MGKYTGCIIEESMKDKTILNEFRIVESVTDDGTSYIVEIDESKIDDIVLKLQAAMSDEKIWYTDLKNCNFHYIIYNDRIFKVNRDFPEQYEEAKEYGLKRGIPEDYLPNKSWAK